MQHTNLTRERRLFDKVIWLFGGLLVCQVRLCVLDVVAMNKTILMLSVFVTLQSVASAQAPKTWTQTAEKKVLTHEGNKLTHYGQWTNPDGTQAAIATGSRLNPELQEVRNQAAGIQSGILRSGTYPLSYELLKEPYPGFVLKGQIERDGIELYESTYVLVTKDELIMLKLNSTAADSKLDLSQWNLGEPLKEGRSKHLELMTDLVKRSNDSIEKFQELVKGLRREQESHNKSEQSNR